MAPHPHDNANKPPHLFIEQMEKNHKKDVARSFWQFLVSCPTNVSNMLMKEKDPDVVEKVIKKTIKGLSRLGGRGKT